MSWCRGVAVARRCHERRGKQSTHIASDLASVDWPAATATATHIKRVAQLQLHSIFRVYVALYRDQQGFKAWWGHGNRCVRSLRGTLRRAL